MPQPAPAEARAGDRSAVVDSDMHAGDGAAAGGKRASTSSGAAQLTPYELEREARIAANRQVLVSLGLDQPPDLLVKPAPAKRGRRAGAAAADPTAPKPPPPPPTRQSKRQRGEAPELQPLHGDEEEEEGEAGARAAAAAVRRRRPCNVVAEFDAKRLSTMAQEHDGLNGYRLETMSEKQLIARARRITNVGKLASFIKLLETPGTAMPAVADVARTRLLELTGQGFDQ